MKAKKSKAKSKTLKQIGLWATIWWGVSGVYVLLLVWLSRNNYAAISESPASNGFFSDWQAAISKAYHNSGALPALLALIVVVWIIGGCLWLRELKRQKISYKAAFKDLFLTVR